jgi:hypothetical protein
MVTVAVQQLQLLRITVVVTVTYGRRNTTKRKTSKVTEFATLDYSGSNHHQQQLRTSIV